MESNWQYSTIHKATCKVIDEQTLWGQTVCRVWLPNQDAVVKVPKTALRSLNYDFNPDIETHRISYISAAAKVAEVLEGKASSSNDHILLAPMESNVIPLPHQIHALSRAISGDKIRYLLADEVGLGKTIEAGLILRELKLRGLVRRTLVVAPKSLAMQWLAEMNTHFNEKFTLINPTDLDVLERLEHPERLAVETSPNPEDNPWLRFPQAIVTLDAVKPLLRRKGWSKENIREYNFNRFENLLHGNWDLIVVDEAHRLGGSTEQVARFKLGQGLGEAAPYVLLLTATPHQGKTDSFQRLMSLLDPMVFPDLESVTRDRVARYVIRTEKRKAVTAMGKPLFLPRTTRMMEVDLSKNHQQVKLYEEVTNYVKKGYNLAIKARKPLIGFLMILLQRIVTSSTHAIRCTLERRLKVLEELKEQPAQIPDQEIDLLLELDGQGLLDELLEINELGLKDEITQVKVLLELARIAEVSGPDEKTVELLSLIYKLQSEEKEDQLKLLIFTEFVPTQEMLRIFLEERGIPCVTLNGSMNMYERQAAQKKFRNEARVLISTDAGGEGLNLQFCHIVINYDLPWNPMRIEQRIGRVDRIGQDKVVRAVNFVYKDSVESRVREVLETKLAIILDQMGIDKLNDVLDTSLSGDLVEKMLTHVIMEDADPEKEIDQTVKHLKEELLESRKDCAVYEISDQPALETVEKLRNHPLPHWLEQMTTSFLHMRGCNVSKNLFGWDLTWPDGTKTQNAVFQSRNTNSEAELLTLENSRVHGLALTLPQMAAGQLLPCVQLTGLPSTISGLWGLFEIRLQTGVSHNSIHIRIPVNRRSFLTVFISEEGKLFLPTARRIWDEIQTNNLKILKSLSSEKSEEAFEKLIHIAEESGRDRFDTLRQEHNSSIKREEERGTVSFNARRKAIERIGLPEVRNYRLALCNSDEIAWQKELNTARDFLPEIRPLLMLRILKGELQ